MTAVTLTLDLPDSIADYLSRLPRGEQNQFAVSAIVAALPDAEEAEAYHPNATAFLSQAALAEDWERPEEDAAWSHLQPAP